MRTITNRLVVFTALFPLVAFAEDTLPDTEFWSALISFLGGVGGMSGLAIAAGVIQLAMVLLKTSYGNLAGKYKLLIVAGLSVGGAIVSGLASGLPFVNALLNGAVLAAIQVFVNEIIKHFTEKKELLVKV